MCPCALGTSDTETSSRRSLAVKELTVCGSVTPSVAHELIVALEENRTLKQTVNEQYNYDLVQLAFLPEEDVLS